MTEKLAYSVAEAAVATGLSVAYLNEAIKVGTLSARTTTKRGENKSRNGKRVIFATELKRFLSEMEEAS
jgi:hypothetical protein